MMLYIAPALHCSLLLNAACEQVGEALLELENDSGPGDTAQPAMTGSARESSMDSIASGGSEDSQHDSASSSVQVSFGSLHQPRTLH